MHKGKQCPKSCCFKRTGLKLSAQGSIKPKLWCMKYINKENTPAHASWRSPPAPRQFKHSALKAKALPQPRLTAWPRPEALRKLRERKSLSPLFPAGPLPLPRRADDALSLPPSLPRAPLHLPQLSSAVAPCTHNLFYLFFRPVLTRSHPG